MTNSKGEIHIHSEGKIVESLLVGMMIPKPLTINLTDFWGYDSELKVILSDSQILYNQEFQLQKYLILRNGSNYYLKPFGADEFMSLMKIKGK